LLSLLPGPAHCSSRLSSIAFSFAFFGSLRKLSSIAFALAFLQLFCLLNEVVVLLEAFWRHPRTHVIHPFLLYAQHAFLATNERKRSARARVISTESAGKTNARMEKKLAHGAVDMICAYKSQPFSPL
jgi:hypothetical protein